MSAARDRALVLAELRRAEGHGVAYHRLRDLIDGRSPALVLEGLAERGHTIRRVPDRHGRPTAMLREPNLLTAQGATS